MSGIGGGILADCFHPEQRGKAIAIYSLAPLIGPAAGPIAGGFIAGSISWRWVFWIVSIADAVVQVSGVFFLQETWAPKLLEQKAKRLRKETGNEKLYSELVSISNTRMAPNCLSTDVLGAGVAIATESEARNQSATTLHFTLHPANRHCFGLVHGIPLVSQELARVA